MRMLTRGALVSYLPIARNIGYAAENIEILATPQSWVTHNIIFLHHLIELIDFFIPDHSDAEEIFILMLCLYRSIDDELLDISFFKKFFLCKFFMMIGIYPEPRTLDDKQLLAFLGVQTTQILELQKYVFIEKKMIQWLRECILLHPHADRLKTMIMEPWC